MELVVAEGVSLRVIEHRGEPGRTPFLLVHGLASNARLWDGVAKRLTGAGHPSAAVDLRGHGESSKVDDGYDYATLAADLRNVIDTVFGRPVVAAGQSWGGNVVLELAARVPDAVEAVAMIDGGFLALSDEFPDFDAVWRVLAPPRFEGLTRSDLLARMSQRFTGWPDGAIDAALANFEEGPDGSIRSRLARHRHREILRQMWEQHPLDVATRVGMPAMVLVAGADGDRISRAHRFVTALERGTLRAGDGHHDLHLQQPDLVADVLLDLVREAR